MSGPPISLKLALNLEKPSHEAKSLRFSRLAGAYELFTSTMFTTKCLINYKLSELVISERTGPATGAGLLSGERHSNAACIPKKEPGHSGKQITVRVAAALCLQRADCLRYCSGRSGGTEIGTGGHHEIGKLYGHQL